MPEIHHFTYGPVNPTVAYLLAFMGSLAALWCTARAREARLPGYRTRWLIVASIILGGAIWLMHFVAMIGFDVPASPIRYDPWLTAASALVAVLVVGIGIFTVGYGRRSVFKVLFGGVVTGAGVAVMHYTGMAAMRMHGTIGYDATLVAASVLIAMVAATVALWFTLVIQGRLATVVAGAVMAVAVTAMHYTAMTALRVHLSDGVGTVPGIQPILLVLPITVLTVVALFVILLLALQAMGGEGFEPLPERPAEPAPPDPAPAGLPTWPASPPARPGQATRAAPNSLYAGLGSVRGVQQHGAETRRLG